MPKRVARGVYIRESRQFLPDGSNDFMISIQFHFDKKLHKERLGYISEGMTVEKASEIRLLRMRGIGIKPKRERGQGGSYEPYRIKTEYAGVYYRLAGKRKLANGELDKCYDILLYSPTGNIVEKVGWESQGYTLEDAVKLRSLRKKALFHPELVGPTFSDLWAAYEKDWLPSLRKGKETFYLYRKHLQPVFGNTYVATITNIQVERFKNQLLQNLEPATVQQILRVMKTVINKAKKWNLIDSSLNNPVNGVVARGYDKRRERFLSVKEARNILIELQFSSCDLYFISKLSLYTGMRLGEILALTVSDIDHENKTIYIRSGKTGARFAYISHHIIDDLNKLRTGKKGNDILIPNNQGKIYPTKYVSKYFLELMNLLRINENVTDSSQKVVFHTFRHTFCSWLAIEGVPLHTIAELAGHKNIAMTQRYAKLSSEAKQAALQLLP